MPKRKLADTTERPGPSPLKRRRTAVALNGHNTHDEVGDVTNDAGSHLGKNHGGQNKLGTPVKRSKAPLADSSRSVEEDDEDGSGSPTPKPDGTTLFSTPRRRGTSLNETPSRTKRADQSAKRKSAQTLANGREEDDWDGEDELARAILGATEVGEEAMNGASETEADEVIAVQVDNTPQTPSKRGRPKGSRNRRSPTPEGDLPPEERYFFQNRSGPPQVSTHALSSEDLLTHDEYFERIRQSTNHHEAEKRYLKKLHARSFPQWRFELDEGYNVCLYGWGSKRHLINEAADWMYRHSPPGTRLVIVNGYIPKLSIRTILYTVGSALVNEDEELKLVGPPHDMIDTLLSHLKTLPNTRVVIMINSIDSLWLRRHSVQTSLARLATDSKVSIIATADTPTMALLWDSTLRDKFNFVFHDCTTFTPYAAEVSVVDSVNELLGRKAGRIGGQEGIGFVLRSLPENARNLYRVLLSEILTILMDDVDVLGEDDADTEDPGLPKRPFRESAEEVGVEYRALYQKASEEFICSSDMNFRFLLKEFHDHQMITSRRDASGTELLGVPLGKEEMEAVLEELVIV